MKRYKRIEVVTTSDELRICVVGDPFRGEVLGAAICLSFVAVPVLEMFGLVHVRGTPEAKKQVLVFIPFMTGMLLWWTFILLGKETVTVATDQVTFVSALGPFTYTRRLVRDGTFYAHIVSRHVKGGRHRYLAIESGGKTLRTHKYLTEGEADVAVEVANEWIQQHSIHSESA